MINIIVAHGLNNEIGLNNELLWHLPEDMRRFREHTLGEIVVMGRKTHFSIGGPLQYRNNIVLSSTPVVDFSVLTLNSIDPILKMAEVREIFIIGGAEVYKAFLPYADRLYITKVKGEFKADTFFPEYNHLLDQYRNIGNEKYSADEKNQYDMTFTIYEKINQKA